MEEIFFRIFIADSRYNIRLILKDTEVATIEETVFLTKNLMKKLNIKRLIKINA